MIDDVARALARAGLVHGQLILRYGGSGPRDTSQAIVLDRDGHPIAVAKTARGSAGRAGLRREHARLGWLAERLPERRRASVPRPLGLEERGEVTVLLESHLGGRRLKDLPGKDRGQTAIDGVLDWLIDFTQAGPAETPSPGDAAWRQQVREPLEQYAHAFARTPAEEQLLAEIEPRLATALGSAPPLVPGHGDLCDANILLERDQVAVVDWDEPTERVLPGADLFYFLTSLAVGAAGLRDRAAFSRGFTEAFLAPGRLATSFRAAWERYRDALGLPRDAALPLFALAWVRFALHKLRYLSDEAAAARPADPQSTYPLTFFDGGGCLNLALTASGAASFAL